MKHLFEKVTEDERQTIKITDDNGNETITRVSELRDEYANIEERIVETGDELQFLQARKQELKTLVTEAKEALNLDVTIPDGVEQYKIQIARCECRAARKAVIYNEEDDLITQYIVRNDVKLTWTKPR